jgi:hypothetical protein
LREGNAGIAQWQRAQIQNAIIGKLRDPLHEQNSRGPDSGWMNRRALAVLSKGNDPGAPHHVLMFPKRLG